MTELTKPIRRSVTVEKIFHGFRQRLVITLHPGGWVEIRESRRRDVVRLDLGTLYAQALVRRAMEQARGRKRGGR